MRLIVRESITVMQPTEHYADCWVLLNSRVCMQGTCAVCCAGPWLLL